MYFSLVLAQTTWAEPMAFPFVRTRLAEIEYMPVSSTLVRETVHHGGDISPLVPPGVAAYIAQHGLYGGICHENK